MPEPDFSIACNIKRSDPLKPVIRREFWGTTEPTAGFSQECDICGKRLRSLLIYTDHIGMGGTSAVAHVCGQHYKEAIDEARENAREPIPKGHKFFPENYEENPF